MGSTGDLVNLCSTAETDPLYTAAVNFCQGFAVGVYRAVQEEDVAQTRHLLCTTQPPQPELKPLPDSCNGPTPTTVA